jgi:hypothetical protein
MLLSGSAYGQSNLPDKQLQSQYQSMNGIIVQAVQPASTLNEANPISSLLWIYDTNTKQVMLCSSRVNMSLFCDSPVKLKW